MLACHFSCLCIPVLEANVSMEKSLTFTTVDAKHAIACESACLKKKTQVTRINACRCCIHLSICIKCALSLTSAFLFSSCNNHACATNKRGQLVFSLKGDSPRGGPAHSAPLSVFLGNGGRVCGAASVLPLM